MAHADDDVGGVHQEVEEETMFVTMNVRTVKRRYNRVALRFYAAENRRRHDDPSAKLRRWVAYLGSVRASAKERRPL